MRLPVRCTVTLSFLIGACAIPASLVAATPHTASTSRSISDPCQLLTQAEASAAMGAPVGPGERTLPRPAHPRCRFFTKDQDELAIDVDDLALFDSYAHLGSQPVPGIGDKALWAHNEFSTQVVIVKGNTMIDLILPRTITMMTPAIQKAARLIASRL